MPKQIHLQQRTPEWMAWRKNKISASMIATIMGLNPKKSPLMLYNQLMNDQSEEVNAYMQKGIDLEPAARQRAEIEFGYKYPEACFEHSEYPYFIASLDGYNADAKYKAVELKVPQANAHHSAKLGVVPSYNYPQLQWQCYICDLDQIMYVSYQDDMDVEFICVKRDDAFIAKAVDAAETFRKCLIRYIEPEPMDMDLLNVDDQETVQFASERSRIQNDIKALEERKDAIDAHLKAMCGNKSALIGGKYRFVKFSRKGNVDVNLLAKDANVDLEKYRKPNFDVWRFT